MLLDHALSLARAVVEKELRVVILTGRKSLDDEPVRFTFERPE